MTIPIRTTGIAVVVLRERAHRVDVLLLKRNSAILDEAWTYIGGGIEAGEKAYETAIREIKEETGLIPLSLYTSNTFDQFYDPVKNWIYLAPVFVAYVADSAEVRLNNEHSEFRWLTFEDAKSMLSIPGTGDVLSFIEDHFVYKKPKNFLRIEVEECSL